MLRLAVVVVVLALGAQACEDTSDACPGWKEAGYCDTYAEQLKEMCSKSCGFCSGGGDGGGSEGGDPGVAEDPRPQRQPETPNLCRDTCSSKDCAWYKSQGHCTKYSAVMMMNCASTCGWCGARMCSPPAVENGWTDFEMTMVPAGAVINAFCYEGYTNYGSSQVTCNDYGELDGSPSCVEVTEEGLGAAQTACQRAVEAAQESTYRNGEYVVPQASTHYIPTCDYSGNFNQIQYDGSKGETFCVDTYRGTEIQGTRIRGKHEYIGCTADSAAEYYARIESERQSNSDNSYDYGSGDSYDYGSGDSYNYDSGDSYNYDSGDSYNYDSGDSYNYDSSDNYNYDSGDSSYNYESGDNTNYDYNYETGSGDAASGADSGGDSYTDYDYTYDESGYDYNYESEGSGDGASGYDYNYESGSGYDDYDQSGYEYNYESESDGSGYNYETGYDASGYDASGYDYGYETGYDESGYDYNYETGYDSGLESSYYEVEVDPYYNTYYSADEEVVAEEKEEQPESEISGDVYYAATEDEGGVGSIDAAVEEEVEEAEEVEEEPSSNKDRRRRRKLRKFRSKRSAEENDKYTAKRMVKRSTRRRQRKPSGQTVRVVYKTDSRKKGNPAKASRYPKGPLRVCLDKVRPDLCRQYRADRWCRVQPRYMNYYCPRTCEVCAKLGLVTPEEKKRTEEEIAAAERLQKQKQQKQKENQEMLEREKLKCKEELKECATDIEVKEIVQQEADKNSIEYDFKMSPELEKLWDIYDPVKDPNCKNRQFDVNCEGHKSRNQCYNKPFYMLQNCRKTCEMCSPLMCQVPSDVTHGYTDPGMPVPPGFKIFISCEDGYYLMGRGTLTCQKDGYYSPGGECVKVTEQLLYRMTPCQREKYRKSQPIELPEVGWIIPEYELVPECDTRGEYLPMQCNRCCCFCVNLSGKEIEGTRFTHASGKRPDCTPYEFNKRPADKYYPNERKKGRLYGRNRYDDNDGEMDNNSKKKATRNQREKRAAGNGFFVDLMEVEAAGVSCSDVSRKCRVFARRGLCLVHAPYMVRFCPRSCGTCPNTGVAMATDVGSGGGSAKGKCHDRVRNCGVFVTAGYCDIFANFMKDNCAASCGVCPHSQVCAPVLLHNGTAFPEGVVPVGAMVHLTCDKDHVLVGQAVVECGAGGQYTTAPGICYPRTPNATCVDDAGAEVEMPAHPLRFFNHRVGMQLTRSNVRSCRTFTEHHVMRCHDDRCWCVDEYGTRVPGTEGHREEPRPCNPPPNIFKRRLGKRDASDCSDRDPYMCELNVNEDRLFCFKYPSEATMKCRRSCGLCGRENALKVCGPVVLEEQEQEWYTEPHHTVLPGNVVAVFRGLLKVREMVCQEDGSYFPSPSTIAMGHM